MKLIQSIINLPQDMKLTLVVLLLGCTCLCFACTGRVLFNPKRIRSRMGVFLIWVARILFVSVISYLLYQSIHGGSLLQTSIGCICMLALGISFLLNPKPKAISWE